MTSHCSAPAGVDEIFVAGHSARIVRREEGDERRDILWLEPAVNALGIDDLGFSFHSVPLHLARRSNIAWNDAIHTDTVPAKVAGEGSREALDRSFAGLVEDEVRQCEVPADRPKIDDGSAAAGAHARDYRLRTEKLVLQVHCEPVVPIIFRDIVELVAVVVCGIVDEDVERAIFLDQRPDARGGRADVLKVDALETRTGAFASLSDSPFRMSMKVTIDRWRANSATIPAPMPEPPPVISTRLPRRLG